MRKEVFNAMESKSDCGHTLEKSNCFKKYTQRTFVSIEFFDLDNGGGGGGGGCGGSGSGSDIIREQLFVIRCVYSELINIPPNPIW
ncbi:Hypothetical predicted protein [Octopus vulgaris]|uniref:Uncharacterized protein n=1 Tax=Octopus vulgaris TaxID=6645 RepID=A0AA36AJH4_OCTVU|nr:Hypothetical predicted protein [Octopus vulgaris]